MASLPNAGNCFHCQVDIKAEYVEMKVKSDVITKPKKTARAPPMVQDDDSVIWYPNQSLKDSRTLSQAKKNTPKRLYPCDPEMYTELFLCEYEGKQFEVSMYDLDKHNAGPDYRRKVLTGSKRQDGGLVLSGDLPTPHYVTTRHRRKQSDGSFVEQDIGGTLCFFCKNWSVV